MDISGNTCAKCSHKGEIQCEKCPYRLCMKCDNQTTELMWCEQADEDLPEMYLCRKCTQRLKKKEKKGK